MCQILCENRLLQSTAVAAKADHICRLPNPDSTDLIPLNLTESPTKKKCFDPRTPPSARVFVRLDSNSESTHALKRYQSDENTDNHSPEIFEDRVSKKQCYEHDSGEATSSVEEMREVKEEEVTKDYKLNTLSENDKQPVRRPMNSFLVFARLHRSLIQKAHPYKDNKSISKVLGDIWSGMTPAEKKQYIDLASKLAVQHKKDHPEYKFRRGLKRKQKTHASSSHTPSYLTLQPQYTLKHQDIAPAPPAYTYRTTFPSSSNSTSPSYVQESPIQYSPASYSSSSPSSSSERYTTDYYSSQSSNNDPINANRTYSTYSSYLSTYRVGESKRPVGGLWTVESMLS